MTDRVKEPMKMDDLAKRIIGLAMKVHRTLGVGFLESIYGNALAIELKKHGVPFETQKSFVVQYEGCEIGYFQVDLVIDDQLIVEIKAVETLVIAHSVQLVNYLAASEIENGLLLNFGPRTLEFKSKTRNYRQSSEPPDLQA